MKHSGQSLHEYAIALGLIALVAIGALQFLGGNISQLLGSFSNGKSQNDVNNLYALVGAGTISAGQAASGPTAVLKINPNTGMVEVSGMGGTVTNVTSTDGIIGSASEELGLLASSTKMSNGQPLPDDIQQLLRQLSTTGGDMGTLYAQIEQKQATFDATNQIIEQQIAQGKYGGPPYYDSSYIQMTVSNANNYINFSQTYQELKQKLGTLAQTDPAMAALQQKVNNYAGAISGITFNNLGAPTFSTFHIDNVKKTDLMSSLSSAPAAMQYFAPVALKTLFSSASSRDATFQQSFMSLGKQMLAGTPIDPNTGLTLNFDASLAPDASPSAASTTGATATTSGG